MNHNGYNFDLTVWQTTDCVRCGGCCYVCQVSEPVGFHKDPNKKCHRLEVIPELDMTTCRSHEIRKPGPCIEYSCRYSGVTERILIARAVLNVLGINPVPNAREIGDRLECMKILD